MSTRSVLNSLRASAPSKTRRFRLWPDQITFHFTAARTSPEINRRQSLEDLARWSKEPIDLDDYPTWRAVFRLLLQIRAPAPLVIVIDEFPYLASDEGGLAEVASELNAAWEQSRLERPMVLVLAGSSVATMEALAASGSPLYGRFDWHGRAARTPLASASVRHSVGPSLRHTY